MKRLQQVFIYFFLFFSQTLNGQSWTSVGPDESNKLNDNMTSWADVVSNSKGDIFTVFIDPANANKLTLKKYNGTAWKNISVGFTPMGVLYIGNTGMAIDKNDNIYVLYSDSAYGNNATVQRFDGTSWSYVGARGFASTASVSHTCIDLDSANNPYVAYTGDVSVSNKAVVQKFNGTTWSIVGGGPVTTGYAQYVVIKIDRKRNIPYIGYTDVSMGSRAYVKSYNGSTWSYTGTTGQVSDSTASVLSMSLDTGGHPYLGYEDAKYLFKPTVKAFDGTIWNTVGAPGFSPYTASNLNLTIDSIGAPYILSIGGGFIYKYDGTTWIELGPSLHTNNNNSPRIFFNRKGELYVGYYNGYYYQYSINKFSGSNWLSTDTNGISGGNIASFAPIIDVDTSGNPYVAYISQNKAFIKYFYSGVWQDAGSPTIGTANSNGTYSFIINKKNNTPYFAYKDVNNKAAVCLLIGSSWTPLGTAVSVGPVNNISFTISASGTPFILFTDSAFGYQAVVMKYTGSSWTAIGSKGFASITTGLSASIAVGKNDTPYIAFITKSGNLVTEKYNGAVWRAFGDSVSAPISHLCNPIIDIDKYNDPVLGYTIQNAPGTLLDTPVIKKYNNLSTSWEVLGSPGLTSGSGFLSCMFIDAANEVFAGCMAAWLDGARFRTNYPCFVQRYNDTNWSYVGSAQVNSGDAYLPSFALSPRTGLFAAYINSALSLGGDIFVRNYNGTFPTSINEVSTAHVLDIRAYPVPCHNDLYISGLKGSNNIVGVYDINGKLYSLSNVISGYINTTNWLAGTYFLHFSQGNVIKVIKL